MSRARSGDMPVVAASQQATGAARRSDAWAAAEASARIASTSAASGAGRPSASAKCSIHSSAVSVTQCQ